MHRILSVLLLRCTGQLRISPADFSCAVLASSGAFIHCAVMYSPLVSRSGHCLKHSPCSPRNLCCCLMPWSLFSVPFLVFLPSHLLSLCFLLLLVSPLHFASARSLFLFPSSLPRPVFSLCAPVSSLDHGFACLYTQYFLQTLYFISAHHHACAHTLVTIDDTYTVPNRLLVCAQYLCYSGVQCLPVFLSVPHCSHRRVAVVSTGIGRHYMLLGLATAPFYILSAVIHMSYGLSVALRCTIHCFKLVF